MSSLTTYIALAVVASHALARLVVNACKVVAVAALVPLCLPLLALAWLGRSAKAGAQAVSGPSRLMSSSRALALSEAMKRNPSADPMWFAERLAEV